MKILQRTAAVYQSLQSYEFKVTVRVSRGSAVAEKSFTMSGLRPAKYKVDDGDPQGELQIADGQTGWILNRASNTYTKTALTPASPTPISDFESITQHVTAADIMREELYVADGKPVMVYVVGVVRNPWPAGTLPDTQFMIYRIDEKTYAVHEVTTHTPDQVDETEIAVYSIVKWNEPISAVEFAFSPPKSTHEQSSVKPPKLQVTSLIGAQAPDFTLHDTTGKTVSLHDFRGKVVIVDFWASWCPPCRAEMPYLQDLHQRFADKGLVVLGLDIGEDADTVTQFAKQGPYTFTLLLGGEPQVDSSYYVGLFPTTFIIDRQGKIAYLDEGFGSPKNLQSEVIKALK